MGDMPQPFVSRAWYVACASKELRGKPLVSSLWNQPLVLFRDSAGTPTALLDRCAHRNVPLSRGTIRHGNIQCGYHGWQYDARGCRIAVPGLCSEQKTSSKLVPPYATCEQDGYVWVYGTPDTAPDSKPDPLPLQGESGYTHVRRSLDVEASLFATAENALDIPHTAFLHRGLFRGSGKPNTIKAVVTRTATSVQAEYIGEPRPRGLAGWILSPSGGIVTHFDRFLLPSVAQVEYRLGDENHFLVTSFCTPLEEHRTRLHAIVSFRTRFPGWLVRGILTPIGLRIFRQDAAILQAQTQSIQHFGGEHYNSTELDIMGPQILRLLMHAGEPDEDSGWCREIELRIG